MAPGRSAPMGGRFARWNGQERAPNREPSQGSTGEVRTSLSRVRCRLPRKGRSCSRGAAAVPDQPWPHPGHDQIGQLHQMEPG